MNFSMIKNLTYLISMYLVLSAIPPMTMKTLRICEEFTTITLSLRLPDVSESQEICFSSIMNPQEIRQVTAHDEKWVPTKERVKISTTNLRLETTVQQKEETFQVMIDVIVEDTESYEFLLANKKFKVDVEVFWKILVCPRVQRTLAAIINNCLSSQTACNDRLRKSRIDILWGIFYRENVDYPATGEDFQEYDLPIPKTMLTDGIKQSESYQTFIKYSTSQIPPKKSRGKVSQGKKSLDVPKADVGVSKESDSKHARKRTTSRRVIKKNVTISIDESIIPDPYVDLELGPTRRRPAGIAFRDTSESKKTSRRQPGTRGSSKGTGRIPGVLDESTVLSTTSSEGTGNKSRVPEEDLRNDEEVDWIYSDKDDEKKDDADDDKSIDLEMTNYEETEDEFVQGKEQVNDDEDKEMTNSKVEESGNGDVKISDAAKADAEKTEEVKDDVKKAELPPTSSRL
nr:hypothetical protein [Tanacetum cinerariifolium]